METLIRQSKPEDLPCLHNIWQEVFSSPDEDLFFDYFYKADNCIVAETGDVVCAMGFILPVGHFVYENTSYPCAMIYALATSHKFRKNGIASTIVSELVSQGRKAGYPITILCPSPDEVFQYYSSKTEFRESFYINEKVFSNPSKSSANTVLSVLSAQDYMNLRNQKLLGTPHIKLELHAVEYQKKLSRLTGGELYMLEGNGWTGIAAVEKLSGTEVLIKELLCPGEHESDTISAIASAFPSHKITARTPVVPGHSSHGSIRRFAMMASSLSIFDDAKLKSAWYGFAFD